MELISAILLLLALLSPSLQPTEAQIGVCYGRLGDHLPNPDQVVNLYKTNGIANMRIYEPNPDVLNALRGSNIGLIVDVHRTDLGSLGSDHSAADRWVQNNILPYTSDVNFRYIVVGNEIMPGDAEAGSILPAMQNVQNALQSANLAGKIKVSTAIKSSLVSGFPPSTGVFINSPYINPIVDFLKSNESPLLATIYPYFSYTGNMNNIPLEYALFTSPKTQVYDGNFQYQNLFDALLDTVYAALDKAGAPNTKIVVSESGWPSGGGTAGSFPHARTYYKNLIGHVKQGTPRKNQAIEAYLFAMFDENQKTGDQTENNFGLFTPKQESKYQLNFNNQINNVDFFMQL